MAKSTLGTMGFPWNGRDGWRGLPWERQAGGGRRQAHAMPALPHFQKRQAVADSPIPTYKLISHLPCCHPPLYLSLPLISCMLCCLAACWVTGVVCVIVM